MKETEYVTCSYCGNNVEINAITYVNDDSLCSQCVEEHTLVCQHCDEIIYESDNMGSNTYPLCSDCYAAYYTICRNCDTLISLSDVYYDDDDDEPLCHSCYCAAKERERSIHNYSYKPDPIFYGNGNRFFGIELEIDGGGTSEENASSLLQIANTDHEHLYIKTDGSLNEGMELVSHPMTMAYHLQVMPWFSILQETVSMGYTSHMAETCGLHVHINRSSFGESHEEQEIAVAKILYMVEHYWQELLVFSRRTEAQLRKWAARYQWKEHPKDVLHYAKNSGNGRYSCVNLLNTATVEWRMCRGTLKYKTFVATLQMIDEICRVATFMSEEAIEHLCWRDFVQGISMEEKPELILYLKSKMLFINEPVTETEEI